MKLAIGSILLVVCCAMASRAADESVGFKLERGYLIVVKCSIGALTDLTGIIDTGVSESVVDISIVKRLGLTIQADEATFLTQKAKVFAVSIPSLQIGSVTTGPIAGIATALHSLTSEYGIRPDILIGMDVLGRANLLIDYKNRQLSFTNEPIPALSHQSPFEGEGRVPLVAVGFQGKTLHLQIDTGSSGVVIYAQEGEVATSSTEMRLASVSRELVANSASWGRMKVADTDVSSSEILMIKAGPDTAFDGLLGPHALHAQRVGLDFGRRIVTWQ